MRKRIRILIWVGAKRNHQKDHCAAFSSSLPFLCLSPLSTLLAVALCAIHCQQTNAKGCWWMRHSHATCGGGGLASGYSMAHYAHKLIYVQREGEGRRELSRRETASSSWYPADSSKGLAWTKDTAAFVLAPSSDCFNRGVIGEFYRVLPIYV